MIKIIDSKRYNTETATEIFHHETGIYGDFNYRGMTLYLTKQGAWFIHHVGGALTDMAEETGDNSLSGSSDIEPLDKDEAYKFLEEHSADEEAQQAIEKYFSEKVTEA